MPVKKKKLKNNSKEWEWDHLLGKLTQFNEVIRTLLSSISTEAILFNIFLF